MRLNAMIDAGECAAAAAHLETLLAACYEKTEEIDDSGGGLGELVERAAAGTMTIKER